MRNTLTFIAIVLAMFSKPLHASDVHIVTEEARTLGDIAVYLYGDQDMFNKIAKWNKITSPYVVHIGQKLTLRKKPTLNPEDGAVALLKLWRYRFYLLPDDTSLTAEDRKIREEFVEHLRKAEEEAEASYTKEEKASRNAMDNGERLLESDAKVLALTNFRKSREFNPENLAPWFYEIHTLRLLNREAEANDTAKLLLSRRPDLEGMSCFRGVLIRFSAKVGFSTLSSGRYRINAVEP